MSIKLNITKSPGATSLCIALTDKFPMVGIIFVSMQFASHSMEFDYMPRSREQDYYPRYGTMADPERQLLETASLIAQFEHGLDAANHEFEY